MSKESFDLPPVLAAPPRRSRIVVTVAAHLAVILGTAGVVALIQQSATGHRSASSGAGRSAGPAATLTSPGNNNDWSAPEAAFSPDGKTLASSVGTSSLYLWDVATRHLLTTLTEPAAKGVSTLAFSPDGKTLAAGDQNGSTYLWSLATRHLLAILTDPRTGDLNAVAFSPDGKTLASGDGSTYLWSLATRHLLATLTDPSGDDVNAVAFSPDGKTLASGNGDDSTYLWSLATGHVLATLTNPGHIVQAVAFSLDGKTLAAGDQNGSTYLWNVATRHLLATLADHGPDQMNGPEVSVGVEALAFSPDGNTLAAGDQSGSTYLWNVATRQKLAALNDAASLDGVFSVAFSPDGATLATGNDGDGTIDLWRLPR